MKLTITKITRALGLMGIGFLAMMPGVSKGQVCSATSTWCGDTYGGNVTAIKISNAAGTIASYSGLGCTGSAAVNNRR